MTPDDKRLHASAQPVRMSEIVDRYLLAKWGQFCFLDMFPRPIRVKFNGRVTDLSTSKALYHFIERVSRGKPLEYWLAAR